MYRGKKFNSRKEDVVEENYLGIRIYRFYIKCVTCSSEITFKTDPKNGDYVAEHGCQRNFEPWREKEAEEEAALKQREDEEKGDAMKALENRTLDSKREMDILDALDEIKAINQRHAKIDTDQLLQQHARLDSAQQAQDEQQQMEADVLLAKQVFEQRKKRPLAEDQGAEPAVAPKKPAVPSASSIALSSKAPSDATKVSSSAPIPSIIVKKKSGNDSKKAKKDVKTAKKPVVTSLVADYSDSSDD
ncbi:hypothetical protein ATCC90586_001654 [Pythium insidiosum]|nr:hypothetical protein ATCC90586_001654 [Pythium insidiosum]